MIEKYSKIIIDAILERKEIKLVDWSDIDFLKLLVQASHNRVLYLFAKKLLGLGISFPDKHKDLILDVIKEGEKNLEVLRNTLLLLDDIFKKEKIDYLVVKTFKYFDYITFDVDFLVRYDEFKKVIDLLIKKDIMVKSHPNLRTQGLHQRNCFKSGFLKMDLHRKFFWLGIDHVDLDFIWSNTTKRKIAGVDCPVPSLEADFLFNNKQLVYERGYITLLDFLAVKYASDEGLNWEDIMAQVRKYKWDGTFFVLLNWLNYMHQEIFGRDMVDVSRYFGSKKYNIRRRKLKLPLIYPLKEVMSVFKEIALNNKHIPILEFLYYFFAMGRYLISNRLPFYDHWYDFNKTGHGKHIVANCIN